MKKHLPDNLDIHRTASIIVGEYGSDALIHAAIHQMSYWKTAMLMGVLPG